MKILLTQFTGRGGLQLYVAQLANALSKTQDVSVLLAKHLRNEDYYKGRTRIFYISIPPSHMKMLMASFNPWTYYKIVKCIKDVNPDVIHAPVEFLWGGLILPFVRQYPFVVTEHDPSVHKGTGVFTKFFIGFSRLFTRRMADAIIVHGERLKTVLEGKGVPGDRIWVIPHGEFSFYTKWAREKVQESKSVLFFGSISEYKGIEYLIEAEPLITSQVPDAKIVIAGSGDFTKYKPLIKNRDKFEIHNRFIPDEEVAEFFQKSAVVALPYTDGSQTGIIPIAYSFGKPAVVTDVGSIAEVVDNGKTGFIVPPRNPEALAKAIVKLLKDDKLRQEMGENARKKVGEELSWDNIAKKTIEVYEGAIRSREKHRERDKSSKKQPPE
jgi:glycosyltransferase involved in cell wall biosynthesis